MTAAISLRDAVVEGVRAGFPVDTVPTVSFYDGPADVDFMKRFGARAPAVVITILGGASKPRGGAVHDRLSFGAYIFAKGTVALQRTAAALAIREQLVRILLHGEWSTTARYQAPSELESSNLFDGEIEGLGLTLWLVGWETVLELPGMSGSEYEALDAFRTLFAQIYEPGADASVDDPLAEQAIDPEQ